MVQVDLAQTTNSEFTYTSPKVTDLQNDAITIMPPKVAPQLVCDCLKFEINPDTFSLVLATGKLSKKDAGKYEVSVELADKGGSKVYTMLLMVSVEEAVVKSLQANTEFRMPTQSEIIENNQKSESNKTTVEDLKTQENISELQTNEPFVPQGALAVAPVKDPANPKVSQEMMKLLMEQWQRKNK